MCAAALTSLTLAGCGGDKDSPDTTAAAAVETTVTATETTVSISDTAAPAGETTVAGPTAETTVPDTAPAAAGTGVETIPPAPSEVCPKADGSSERRIRWDAAPPTCIDAAKTYTATVDTSKGSFTITFDPARAPVAVNNFVFLARWHYYDGSAFHRVVPNFVIQGGSLNGDGRSGPGYSFADELPQTGEYKIGSLAMANAGPDTNDSQFFVITGSDGVQLPPSYSLFGQVTSGMDVVDAIAALGQGDGPPSEPVTITKVTIDER